MTKHECFKLAHFEVGLSGWLAQPLPWVFLCEWTTTTVCYVLCMNTAWFFIPAAIVVVTVARWPFPLAVTVASTIIIPWGVPTVRRGSIVIISRKNIDWILSDLFINTMIVYTKCTLHCISTTRYSTNSRQPSKQWYGNDS